MANVRMEPFTEREERLTRSSSGLLGGAAQSLGYDQTMVVIARELGECVAALHPCREELPESKELSVVWRRTACLATAGSAK